MSAVGVVILGMGRSGTSAVTGMFASAGFFVGSKEDLMPAADANPAGHWENMHIYDANEQILDRLGGSWFDPPAVSAQLVAQQWGAATLRIEVERLVDQSDGAPVAIKDPRIGVMTPLWHSVIADLLHPVLVVRDPIEIARSLERRDGTPPTFALASWELHMGGLIDYLSGRVVTVAPYARLLEDHRVGELVVEQAAAHLVAGRATCVRPADAARALEREFRHHSVAPGEHDEQLTGRQLGLWRWLASLSPGDRLIDAPAELRAPSVAARLGARNETARAQLVRDLAAERGCRVDLETKLVSAREQATSLAARLAIEEQRTSSTAATLVVEQRRSAALLAEVASERERLDVVTAAHLQAEGWLAAIQGSASWRLTAPLRAAKRLSVAALHRERSEPRRLRRPGAKAPNTITIPPRRGGRRLIGRRGRRGSPRATRYEIHVPISPTPQFFTRVYYLAASLRRFGGALADSPIVVTVGADETSDLDRMHPWARRLGIEWRWLDDALWRRHGIYATALQRFCYEIETPNALLLDSDTLFIRPIDDLLAILARSHAIAGVTAHVSPFIGCEGEQGLWQRIFHAAGLGEPSLECEHPGWQAIEFDAARRYCPPYFNLGVLFAPRDVFRALAKNIYAEMETVERVHPTLFRCQLALTMAIVRSGVDWRRLPLRFNLPNIPQYLPRYRTELADARIIHYLKDEQLTRADDFASAESVGMLLSRDDLNPFNLKLRDALRQVHNDVLAGD